MIKEYEINKLKYDFMGYTYKWPEELSFHHLIVPKRDCPKAGYGNGYQKWNGAILKQLTSHNYLHTIERIDRELFLRITKYMIEENQNGKIDIDNLKRIREILLLFEDLYKDEEDKKGIKIIKPCYKLERIKIPGLDE